MLGIQKHSSTSRPVPAYARVCVCVLEWVGAYIYNFSYSKKVLKKKKKPRILIEKLAPRKIFFNTLKNIFILKV